MELSFLRKMCTFIMKLCICVPIRGMSGDQLFSPYVLFGSFSANHVNLASGLILANLDAVRIWCPSPCPVSEQVHLPLIVLSGFDVIPWAIES